MCMSLPLFYSGNVSAPGTLLELDEFTARHVTHVLRMKKGDRMMVTNGKGKMLTAIIQNQHKKGCGVYVESDENIASHQPRITIAISLLKNVSRFEWFLEKAAETGVHSIVPLICERTERTHFRAERMRNILISAMLQSQQCWLPELSEPMVFDTWVSQDNPANRFIAHCMDTLKTPLARIGGLPGDKIIGIGPEGDFTQAEISRASEFQFLPVSIGNTRLRTETAGIAAAIFLRIQ